MSEQAPPPVGPRGIALRCGMQGADAHAAGLPVLACPYGPARPFARRSWVTGYGIAARAAGTPSAADVEVDESAPWPGDTPTLDAARPTT